MTNTQSTAGVNEKEERGFFLFLCVERSHDTAEHRDTGSAGLTLTLTAQYSVLRLTPVNHFLFLARSLKQLSFGSPLSARIKWLPIKHHQTGV